MKFSILVALYCFVLSVVDFFLCKSDKSAALLGRRRIPEKTMLLFAWLGGAFGLYFGMRRFHHKTKKPVFRIVSVFSMFLWFSIIMLPLLVMSYNLFVS
jgi:uncharacterized membrane protein YsdA (DUF1294 family)